MPLILNNPFPPKVKTLAWDMIVERALTLGLVRVYQRAVAVEACVTPQELASIKAGRGVSAMVKKNLAEWCESTVKEMFPEGESA